MDETVIDSGLPLFCLRYQQVSAPYFNRDIFLTIIHEH